MTHFTVSRIGDELIATFKDGKHILIAKQEPTDDFILDCACLLDTIASKHSNNIEKEGK